MEDNEKEEFGRDERERTGSREIRADGRRKRVMAM